MSDVQLLRTVAERLCAVATGSEDEIRAALAMPTTPPPFGARACDVTAGVLSRASVELKFATPTFTRADFDATFGAADELPRTGPGAAYVLAYTVAVAAAPAKVTLFARFPEKPQPTSGAKTVLLRIDPA